MIRVLYFSDAHIEIRQGDESHAWSETRPLGLGPDLRPFVGTVDLLVLAGDIDPDHEPRQVIDLPPLAKKRERDPKLRASCVHCHTVHETLHRVAVETGTVTEDTKWVYPPPARLGAAVLHGPRTANFAGDYARLDAAGAARMVADADALAAALADPATAAMPPRAEALIAAGAGEIAALARRIVALVPARGGAA